MKTVLVTGPIGSGKSEVCRRLASSGWPVYDCDSRTKALYSSVPGLKARIESALGIEWADIGIIFTDERRRTLLESIVYPLVVEDIRKWKDGQSSPLLFIESALAMDRPLFDGLYDEVLLVTADSSLREARNHAASLRGALQSFDLSKVDYVIENNSSIEDLHLKTDKLLCRLI